MVGFDVLNIIRLVIIIPLVFIMVILLFFLYFFYESPKSKNKEETAKKTSNEPKVVSELKPLTAEQIADIHSRGKITPAEMVQEWEDMELCAPGNAIGSASYRCHKFIDCHNCLVDYANQHEEYTSFYDFLNITNNQNNLDSVTLVNPKLDDN